MASSSSTSSSSISHVERAKQLLRAAAAVCFDVDSTVQLDESIDVLAEVAGRGEQVRAMTNAAMNGAVKFEETLKARLDLIQPSRAMLAQCLQAHPPRLSPGVAEFIAELHKAGKRVFLVSGGFTDLIYPIADMLDIPRQRVFANVLLFRGDHDDGGEEQAGSYAGFDPAAFTARSGGKLRAVQHIKQTQLPPPSGGSSNIVVMVGDGATDMEARVGAAGEGSPEGADAFIGYGGVVVREKVKAGADWFVNDFAELLICLRTRAHAEKDDE